MKRRTPLRKMNRERLEYLHHIQYDGGCEHHKYIRQLPCIICQESPPSVVHHAKTRASGGRARHMVPICWEHHKEAHSMGAKSFDAEYGINLLAVAEELWQAHQRALEQEGTYVHGN